MAIAAEDIAPSDRFVRMPRSVMCCRKAGILPVLLRARLGDVDVRREAVRVMRRHQARELIWPIPITDTGWVWIGFADAADAADATQVARFALLPGYRPRAVIRDHALFIPTGFRYVASVMEEGPAWHIEVAAGGDGAPRIIRRRRADRLILPPLRDRIDLRPGEFLVGDAIGMARAEAWARAQDSR